MIECIFTIDYEIYGNGEGSLRALVYEPAERLRRTFQKRDARFVVFVEVAELEMIEATRTDPAIDLVKHQLRNFYREGFELGLHVHPQWFNAQYGNGRWLLDYSEYNLCTLPRERIVQIIDRSIAYFREVLGVGDFTPLSFRAGNWLFQPTRPAADVLTERGIKVDSSVFKGGVRHQHKLDYRRALRNGCFWRFTDAVDTPDSEGALLELPIYTRMVPFWKLLTAKRIGMERKGASPDQIGNKTLYRLLDVLRFWHPQKFDLCRMTIDELIGMVDTAISEDSLDPQSIKPIIAIGHTKELVDFSTIEALLSYLDRRRIAVSTFDQVYQRCMHEDYRQKGYRESN